MLHFIEILRFHHVLTKYGDSGTVVPDKRISEEEDKSFYESPLMIRGDKGVKIITSAAGLGLRRALQPLILNTTAPSQWVMKVALLLITCPGYLVKLHFSDHYFQTVYICDLSEDGGGTEIYVRHLPFLS